MSATTKGQKKSRRKPRSTLRRRSPITLIGEPFAAYRTIEVGRTSKDFEVSGRTETSASLSTKKYCSGILSLTRRQNNWQLVVVNSPKTATCPGSQLECCWSGFGLPVDWALTLRCLCLQGLRHFLAFSPFLL